MDEPRNSRPRWVWLAVVRSVWLATDSRHLDLIAAGVAFYAMFAIFPAVAAVVALWGFFADPGVIEAQLELLARLVPAEAYALLEGQVRALIAANDSTLGWTSLVSMLVALWATRAGMVALTRGINAVYGIPHRGGLRRNVVATLLTVAMIAISLLALAAIVAFPIAIALMPEGSVPGALLSVLRWILVIAVMLFGLGLIYRYGPNRPRAHGSWVSRGAIFALAVWGAASWAFSTYLANFGAYNEVYGSIGAVVALLMWFFIGAYAVLLGAAINAEIERRRAGG